MAALNPERFLADMAIARRLAQRTQPVGDKLPGDPMRDSWLKAATALYFEIVTQLSDDAKSELMVALDAAEVRGDG